MANNKTKNIIVTTISVLLCLALGTCGYLYGAQFNSYTAEKIDNITITNGEALIGIKENLYNDNITLAGDIYISDSSFSFGSKNNPFVGSFNGNGHTVFCNFDKVDASSLFGYIGKDGIIKNTNFVFGKISVSSEYYGAIAMTNYGTIKDCSVDFEKIAITKEVGYYSSLVAINYGTISHVIIDSTFCTDINDTNAVIGPICAYNYGSIQNVLSLPKFIGFDCTNKLDILSNKTTNHRISAVCSFYNDSGVLDNTISFVDVDVYTSDNNKDGLTFANSVNEIFNEQTIFYNLDFHNDIWELANGKLELIKR